MSRSWPTLRDVRPGAILPEVIRTGRSIEGVFRREGSIEYVVDMAPIIIDDKIVGGVSVVKDITEVQRLSAELKKYVSRNDRLKTAVRHAYQASTLWRILSETVLPSGGSSDLRNGHPGGMTIFLSRAKAALERKYSPRQSITPADDQQGLLFPSAVPF